MIAWSARDSESRFQAPEQKAKDWQSKYEHRVRVFIADELWAWRDRALWDALWSATGKVPSWRVIVFSNAGYDTQSISWEVRELARAMRPPFLPLQPRWPHSLVVDPRMA